MEISLTMQVRDKMRRLSQIGLHRFSRVAGATLIAGIALASNGLHAASNTLLDITHVSLPGNKQQLALTMSGPAVEPKAFTIDNPARIALDLPDTSNGMDSRSVSISSGLLQNVTTIEAGGRTRVVVNLTALAPYSTTISGNQLLINLDPSGKDTLDNDVADPVDLAAATPATDDTEIVRQRSTTINGLDFRRGPMGEGRIIFDLSSAGAVTDLRREGGR